MKEIIRQAVVRILTLEAKLVVRKYKPRIVLITGSVGKTSAKDAAYTTLSSSYFVRRSEKSFNSDIGAPLTVLGIPNGWSNPVRWLKNIVDGLLLIILKAPYPQWLIVEVGADRPGDITQSLAWLKPEVVVATRFPSIPVHVEFYDSPEAVQAEEFAPVSWLRPGGVMVGNADDELVHSAPVPEGVTRLMYGIHEGADLRATHVRTTTKLGMPTGTSFDLTYGTEKAHVNIEFVVGMAHVYALLAGVGAALAVGVPLAAAAEAVIDHQAPPGRMKLVPGIKKSVLVDDSYNASPVAVEEALKTLAALPHKGRRIAVLGDMLELGAYSVAEHEKAGAQAASSADILVTVGVRARGYATGAEKAGMNVENILQFDKSSDAAQHLLGVVGEGDVVLVKGSQGIRTERISKALMANPEMAKKLLPRQDAEWLAR